MGLDTQDPPDYKPEFRVCTVGVDAGCTEKDTVLGAVTITDGGQTPVTTNSPDPTAVSLNLKDLTQPVLMNQTSPSDQADRATAGGGNLELALPDYYQLEINIAIPNRFTLTAVGVSLTGTLDRYGNVYGGIGPSVGKSILGVSGAGTANYIIDGSIRTVRNEDGLASFLSGHSVTEEEVLPPEVMGRGRRVMALPLEQDSTRRKSAPRIIIRGNWETLLARSA